MYVCRDGRWMSIGERTTLSSSMTIITRVPFW